ncbi:MAG: hypothetical protein RI965_1795 [Bacteroidota bacterium]
MNMRSVFIIICSLILLASCRSTRKLTNVISVKDSVVTVINPYDSDSAKFVRATLQKIRERQIQFKTFSSKIKVDYNDDKNRKFDFNTFFRMQKDSALWISIVAALNIEAFRVLIRPDSIIILDKLNKTVQRKPFSYLQVITKVPFDYQTLENLILGNPIYLDKEAIAFTEKSETLSFSTIGEAFKNFLTVSRNDLNVLFSKLDDIDVTRSRTASLAYAGYVSVGERIFAEQRKIDLAEKTQIQIVLDFKQVEFDKPLSFPFSIPKNYKIKD